MNQEQQPNISTVGHLRKLLPNRPLRIFEALRVAETQASRLRLLCGDHSPNFDTDQLTQLPRIDVEHTNSLQASGSTRWESGAWRISINTSEPLVRQRFTLAHEFKHILDAPAIDSAYSAIHQRIDHDQQIEAICDYFAACLLMPKRWVKRLWGEGIRELDTLADVFDVSQVAMRRRLESIGLIDRQARIINTTSSPAWTPTDRRRPNRAFYRTSRPRPTPSLEAA